MKTTVFKNYAKVSVILEAWKMKFGQDATVIRLVGGIQAMEMQVIMHDGDGDGDDDDNGDGEDGDDYNDDDEDEETAIKPSSVASLAYYHLSRLWWTHSTESFKSQER